MSRPKADPQEVAGAQLTLERHEREQARLKAERDARLRARDVAYKLALGLDTFAPLPKALGPAGGAHGPHLENLRGTRRPVR